MQRLLVISILFGLMFIFVACSSDDDSPDAGVNDGDNVITDGLDGYSDIGSDLGDPEEPGDGADGFADNGYPGDSHQRPDFDLTDNFLLVVPPKMSLCTCFLGLRSWQQELAMGGRIDLRPGYYLLPRQEGFHQIDLTERVWFGHEGMTPTPDTQNAGFEATYSEAGSGEMQYWDYDYSKRYWLDDQPYLTTLRVHLYKRTDHEWPTEVILDQDFFMHNSGLPNAQGLLGAGENPIEEVQYFGICDPPTRGGEQMIARTQKGEEVTLDVRKAYCAGVAGNIMDLRLHGAVVLMNGESRVVDNPLHLVHTEVHHDFDWHFFIWLALPVGNVAGVLLYSNRPYDGSTGLMSFVDLELNELSQKNISWEVNPW